VKPAPDRSVLKSARPEWCHHDTMTQRLAGRLVDVRGPSKVQATLV